MFPTLQAGDRVLVSNVNCRLPDIIKKLIGNVGCGSIPKKGDIVVFSRFSEYQSNNPGQHYIKRVVAIPGDFVGVLDDQIVVNIILSALNGPATSADLEYPHFDYGPVKLKAGEYFVSGDNSANSKDSRFYGPIRLQDIEGTAIMILWSSEVLVGRTKLRLERIGMGLSRK